MTDVEKAAEMLREAGWTVITPDGEVRKPDAVVLPPAGANWAIQSPRAGGKRFNWQCSPDCPATNFAPCIKTVDGAECPAIATHH